MDLLHQKVVKSQTIHFYFFNGWLKKSETSMNHQEEKKLSLFLEISKFSIVN